MVPLQILNDTLIIALQ